MRVSSRNEEEGRGEEMGGRKGRVEGKGGESK